MAVNIITTKKAAGNVRILVYGESGIGKTYLIRTALDPIVISSERKALSLAEHDIPFLPVHSYEEAKDFRYRVRWQLNS